MGAVSYEKLEVLEIEDWRDLSKEKVGEGEGEGDGGVEGFFGGEVEGDVSRPSFWVILLKRFIVRGSCVWTWCVVRVECSMRSVVFNAKCDIRH